MSYPTDVNSLDKTQGFTKEIEVKQRELQPWSAKIRQKQGEIDIARNEQEGLIKKVETAKNAGADAQSALDMLKSEQSTKDDQRSKVQQEKVAVTKEIQEKQREFQDLKVELSELRSKAAASQQRVEEAKASQAQNKSANAVLDSLTKLSQTGRVHGFHVSASFMTFTSCVSQMIT